MNLKDTFQKVVCVNLSRRPDRWERFLDGVPEDFPFRSIKRVPAVDGQVVPHPHWWKSGPGAWGCYRSHLKILERAIANGTKSLLIFEDDAIFPADFRTKTERFFKYLPEDWEMIYLGGQHLWVDKHPPKKINRAVFQPYNINRTHCFGLRGEMLKVVYKHLTRKDWVDRQHIDHHLGRLHQRRDRRIYCPWEWIVGQSEGDSDITDKQFPNRYWAPAEQLAEFKPDEVPFVAVLGLHSSGSSALAGVLYHLGLHLGNELAGYYGTDPEKACGFEAIQLMKICEEAIPFPAVELKIKKGQLWGKLKAFINEKKREAHFKQTIPALKYPQLCQMGNQLKNICGETLRVIDIQRPVKKSIKSMSTRWDIVRKDIPPAAVERHQRWLLAGKRELIQSLPEKQVLTVKFERLLKHPRVEITRIKKFLRIQPTSEQVKKASESVKPSKPRL